MVRARNPFHPCLLDGDDPEIYRDALVQMWRDAPPERVLVADRSGVLEGCLGARPGVEEPLSASRQTAILDLGGTPAAVSMLLEVLSESSREREDRFVTLLAGEDDLELHASLEHARFAREIVRIRKHLAGSLPAPASPRYRVRPFREPDRSFILWLAGETLLDSVARVRGLTREHIRRGFTQRYLHLPLRSDDYVTLILEDASADDEPCGFLVYDRTMRDRSTGGRPAYILDIATHPDHWGTGASVHLMLAGEEFLKAHEASTVFADISVDNPRPLSRATRSLGYTICAAQWVRVL